MRSASGSSATSTTVRSSDSRPSCSTSAGSARPRPTRTHCSTQRSTSWRRVSQEIRELAPRPASVRLLSERGLTAALEALVLRMPLPVELEARPDRRLPEPVEAAAFYVVAEALANVHKHAGRAPRGRRGRRSTASGSTSASSTTASAALIPAGHGLRGLADRVEALGGRLAVDSPPAADRRLVREVPYAGAVEAPSPGPSPRAAARPRHGGGQPHLGRGGDPTGARRRPQWSALPAIANLGERCRRSLSPPAIPPQEPPRADLARIPRRPIAGPAGGTPAARRKSAPRLRPPAPDELGPPCTRSAPARPERQRRSSRSPPVPRRAGADRVGARGGRPRSGDVRARALAATDGPRRDGKITAIS